ncbi:integrase core domain-containing protein [Dactylosporangium sp. NPDC000555]|uniref:integrase core domain-containing protein n=1 Tax=Dactylosporangium sp. NPDC000555 TaxID=3154260 RepID=UPI00332472DA
MTATIYRTWVGPETLQGRRAFTDEREARLTAFRWLHRYNTVRRHSRLGRTSTE